MCGRTVRTESQESGANSGQVSFTSTIEACPDNVYLKTATGVVHENRPRLVLLAARAAYCAAGAAGAAGATGATGA
jgi:hypothetical protein